MSLLRFLVEWANVPFTIVAGIALVFALLQMTGILGLLAGGGDGHDADHDVDGDHDVDAAHDAEASADHDTDHDAEHDADNDGGGHSWSELLVGPLGFGKIPFSLIWQTYAVVFAATGLSINARFFYAREGGPPLWSLAWVIPIALLAGYAVVATLARLVGPIFSTKAQQATSRSELVGQTGVVISSSVTKEFGEVRIRDKTGHDLRVVCKLAEGQRAPSEHQRVVIVDYESSKGELLVAPLDDEEVAAPSAARGGDESIR